MIVHPSHDRKHNRGGVYQKHKGKQVYTTRKGGVYLFFPRFWYTPPGEPSCCFFNPQQDVFHSALTFLCKGDVTIHSVLAFVCRGRDHRRCFGIFAPGPASSALLWHFCAGAVMIGPALARIHYPSRGTQAACLTAQ